MSDIRFNQWLHNSGTGGVSQVDGGHVGIGTTNPLIPVGSGNTSILNVGVVTANSYYGSGANLTGISGVSVANQANNRLITATGTTDALNGESTLTYDGTYLDIGGGVTRFTKQGSYNALEIGYGQNGNQNAFIDLIGDTTYSDYGTRIIRNGQNGANAQTDILHRGTGSLNLQTSDAADIVLKTNGNNVRFRVDSSGRVGINKTPALASSKLEVGGADNYPLINVEASGATAGMGIGGGALQFFYGTSEKVRITSDGYIRLGNIGHSSSKVGGQNITGQDYDPYFKLYASTNNHWLMQLRSDTGTGGNGIFLRSGNSSSTYTLYTTGYDENNAHFLVRGDGVCSIGAKYTQGGANPQLSIYGSSGRQFKIMNSGSQTTSMQLQNSTTGYGEDAGVQFACLGGGGTYLVNQHNNVNALEWYSKVSGSGKHIMRVYNDGKIGHQTNSDNLMLSNSQDGSGSNYFLRGSKNSTTPGGGNDCVWIYEDGDIRNNNNSYGQQSDIKLKENIVDAGTQWDDIKNLKVRKFNFKASTGFDTHTQIGLIAQEAELVSPGLVKEVKDRVKTEEISEVDGSTSYKESLSETEKTKHVMYSVLYMKAIKALQEAMTRIETLEAKVTALEGS